MEIKITEAGGIIIEATNDAQPLDDTIPVVVESTANPRVVILGRKSDSNDLEQLSTTTWITRALQATGMTPQELDRFEREDGEFFGRVADGFSQMAAADPKRWLVIDGTPAKDDLEKIISAAVNERLGI